jgi:glycosyltransferase involved in cell wall biosynthesis
MNVLYLTMNANRASTTSPTEGWFRLLRPRGLAPVLVSDKAGAFHEWALQQGIPAYHVPLPGPSKLAPWRFVRSLWRLRRLVKRHGIQLIHCNEQDIYPIGNYLGRLCGLPVVVSIHFTMNRPYCEWAFAGARQPKRIFFISQGSREACREGVDGIIPEAAWRLLPNGLDLEHYRPDAARREEFRREHGLTSEPVVGVACALRPRKQLEHLFEAVSRLSVPGVRILLAGSAVPGDEAYAENLLQQAKQRLGNRLLHVGHLTELRGFYNALDICVNTSQEEACSITILEALACGCPVVGYPSKSVDEQVLPGGGEIVGQDRVEELTAALDRWLSDPRKLTEARRGARRRVEENYDIRDLAGQLWSEYQSILMECGREGSSSSRDGVGCSAMG